MRCGLALALTLAGCGHPAPSATTYAEGGEGHAQEQESDDAATSAVADEHFVFINVRTTGGDLVTIEVQDGVIASVGAEAPEGLSSIDLEGRVVAPAFIDSHVHLAYHFGVGAQQIAEGQASLAVGGLVGAVDLAAPVNAMSGFDGKRWQTAGPMITATGGYPTRSWGAAGYGLEVAGTASALAAVDTVADAGARVVKVPIDGDPALTDDELVAVVKHAHDRGLQVVSHALGDEGATRAANAGVDVLAHTPLEPLSDATIALWSDRIVVSTLRAFGGSSVAVDNLRRLHQAGATVLYGTDLGNSRVEGIDPAELRLLQDAGLSLQEIVAAGSRDPAAIWAMDELGALHPGHSASLIVLDDDPADDVTSLSRPLAVYIDGELVGPSRAFSCPESADC